jgi:hypothetical protein
MLEPDSRQLLVDGLRPPPGFRLEGAFGTTFSLDLTALMTAPLAFALFDREAADGTERQDPIALLQALRSQARRISIFCQAGQIAVPRDYRSLFVYLEESVFPVVPPKAEAIFHPKVWYLKFTQRDGLEVRYRLLCLSRNLTFDRSWDTVLHLDGLPGTEVQHFELESFGDALVAMTDRTMPMPAARANAVRGLAREFARANWDLPEGFESLRFWPLGHDGEERNPFQGRRDRMLVISPFVTQGMLASLTKPKWNKGSVLVSRAETLEQLGGQATEHLAERLVLGLGINDPIETEAKPAMHEAVAESAATSLQGLHAKCYVADAGWKGRLWTGSANCTDAAFHGNVEFLVELTGKKPHCGVQAVLAEEGNRLGLRKLLEPFMPANPEPQLQTAEELAEMQLERLQRAIGSMPMTATCSQRDDGSWNLQLRAAISVTPLDTDFGKVAIAVRPITLGASSAQRVELSNAGFGLDFVVSEQALTPHFAVRLDLHPLTVDFLIIAPLVGAPPDRTERVLTDILRNRADVLRFLLLLLGNVDVALDALAADAGGWGGVWQSGAGSDALLEPLVTAFARDPERLREIGRFIGELRHSESAGDLLPAHWNEIWEPIAAALSLELSA